MDINTTSKSGFSDIEWWTKSVSPLDSERINRINDNM